MILSAVQRWRAGHGLLWMSFKEDLYFVVQMDPIVKRDCSRLGAAGCGLDSVLCRDYQRIEKVRGVTGFINTSWKNPWQNKIQLLTNLF